MKQKQLQTQLQEQLKRDIEQRQKAQRERSSVVAQTIYLGSIGLMLILPIVGGAYLGHWLDQKSPEFSSSWTISFILIGLGIGVANIFFFMKEH